MRIFLVLVSIGLLGVSSFALAQSVDKSTSFLVIIVDGLRPDYVVPELMPRLSAVSKEGVVCEDHHSVYPTVTRVNSSTFATGMYPRGHGIVENTVYFPNVDKSPLTTSLKENLERIWRVEGQLLTATTLGELLAQKGMNMLACSAGSSGSAFLMNPTGAGAGIMHYAFTLPKENRLEIEKFLGPEPPDAYPSEGRNRYAVDAYLKIGVPQHQPKVTYLWLTDPDHTAHKYGIGSALAEQSLRKVDAHIGRILDAHAESKARVNVFVTSDHGFSTHRDGKSLLGLLMGAGLKRSPSSNDVVISGNAIYVNEGGPDRIRAIAGALMKAPTIGAIFSKAKKPKASEGVIPGTLSFDLIHWSHPRSGDLLVSPRWTDERNEKGYQGVSYQPGVAGHGSASRWDIHNTLIAFGPDMKRGTRNPAPTGNVDIAPTLAWVLDIDDYKKMDGRPMRELFRDGPELDSIQVQRQVYRAENSGGDYSLTLSASSVDGKRYIDFAKVERP